MWNNLGTTTNDKLLQAVTNGDSSEVLISKFPERAKEIKTWCRLVQELGKLGREAEPQEIWLQIALQNSHLDSNRSFRGKIGAFLNPRFSVSAGLTVLAVCVLVFTAAGPRLVSDQLSSGLDQAEIAREFRDLSVSAESLSEVVGSPPAPTEVDRTMEVALEDSSSKDPFDLSSISEEQNQVQGEFQTLNILAANLQ
ncbi:MAG: hypothetical protein V1821_02540 [bacterium]